MGVGVRVVKVVIGVKVKCIVVLAIIINKTNVPADLRSSVSVVIVVLVVKVIC